jgi:hypothetical protein
MSNNSDEEDALGRACALVGRFQYHFARVEQKVDQAVSKLLDLDDKAASIVTGSVDFAKKLNLVRTCAYQQAGNEADRNFAQVTCDAVFSVNNDRVFVVHSSFEAAANGVQFKRTVAKDGKVTAHDQTWDAERFWQSYQKMRTLQDDLDQLITRIAPTDAALRWIIPGLLPELPAHLQQAQTPLSLLLGLPEIKPEADPEAP